MACGCQRRDLAFQCLVVSNVGESLGLVLHAGDRLTNVASYNEVVSSGADVFIL